MELTSNGVVRRQINLNSFSEFSLLDLSEPEDSHYTLFPRHSIKNGQLSLVAISFLSHSAMLTHEMLHTRR